MAYPLAGLCQLLGVRRMDDGELQVHGNWTASTGVENRATTYFGNAHYRLRTSTVHGGSRRKKLSSSTT